MQVGSATHQTSVWRRPAVLRLLVIAFAGELGIAILNASAMPIFLRDGRKFSEGVVGAVFAAFLISEAVFKPFAGHWADKFGRRPFLIAGPVIFVFTTLLTILVPPTWGQSAIMSFLLLRVFDGLAAAMMWPALYAAVGDSVENKERGQAMGLLNVCFMLGLALGLPIGGGIDSLTGSLQASFILAAGVFISTAIIAAVFAPKKITHHAEHEGKEMRLSDMWVCMKRIPYVLILGFITFMAVGFPAPIVKLFAMDTFRIDEFRYGVIVALAAGVAALFSSYLGALGERIGRGRAVRMGLLLCSLGAWPIGLGLWIAELRSAPLIIAGAMLIGLGFLLAIPAWYSAVSHVDSRRSGSYLGVVMTAQGVGAIVGVVSGGNMYSINRFAPFLACAVGVTIGWALSSFALSKTEPAT